MAMRPLFRHMETVLLKVGDPTIVVQVRRSELTAVYRQSRP